MTDEERKDDYAKSARQPWRWYFAAENLFNAAAVLRSNYDNAVREIEKQKGGRAPAGFYIDHQAHYLEGKSIELYVKCLLIKFGAEVTNGGRLTRKMNSHDLRSFCQMAQLDVTESESETLRKLTEAITFWGTYPIPTKVESWRREVPGISGIPPIWFWAPGDTDNYTRIVRRLRQRIGPIELSG